MEELRKPLGLVPIALLLLAGVPHGARAQEYPAPLASAVQGGSYTVSYQASCAGIPYALPCGFTYLQERREPGGGWETLADATGSVAFENKPAGSYAYRVFVGIYEPGLGSYLFYSPAITVTVAGTATAARVSLPVQMGHRYELRQGDSDGDGRADLFLSRVSGGAAADGTIRELVLQQTSDGRSFVPVVPSQSLAAIAAAWPLSQVQATVGDVNVDGYVDVTLGGVAATGVAMDQIVFAPGEPGRSEPLGIRAFDDALASFSGNMLDYFADQAFFVDNAPYRYYDFSFSTIYCDPWAVDEFRSDYGGFYWPYYAFCYIEDYTLYGIYQDYSVFSDAALLFWANEQDAIAGVLDEDRALAEVALAVESLLGTPIGGWPIEEILGPSGAHADPFVRRGIEIGQSVLGQARGGRNRSTSRLIPPQEIRLPDRIYITGHPLVFARSRGHLALEYVDSLGGGIPYSGTTISAEPENNNFFDFGKLVARDDRPTDHPLLNFYIGQVEPLNTSAFNYWTSYLRQRHRHYQSLPYELLADYALVPSVPAATYNSNSYVSGVTADATGNARITVPFGIGARYPGWSGPVPDAKFR